MPVLDDATAAALGERLWTATRERQAIPRISDEHPAMDAVDAYRVQSDIIRRRIAAGERIVGWKLGLTSKAMQDQLGVNQPDYSPILSGWMVPEGVAVPTAELIQPRVEAEIAFVLKSPLRGPGVTREDAIAAAEGIVAAIEIIDSRIQDWKITLPDTISDQASSARVTTSGRVVPIDGFDVRLVGAVLERDAAPGSGGTAQVVGVGAGAAALGDPAAALAWAANTFGPLGVTMEPGQIVMTGALHASVPVTAGESYTARFDRLGTVTVRFS